MNLELHKETRDLIGKAKDEFKSKVLHILNSGCDHIDFDGIINAINRLKREYRAAITLDNYQGGIG